MANRRFIDFPIASTSGDTDIILIWQDGANKQTTKATFLSGLPENLDELNDVAISGLTNGQILRYDSVTGKWENTDQGNLDLNDLNDVSIVSPSNGQVLVYNSSTSKWENSSGGYVPYVGAVTTVDLGAQGLRAGYVRFDTSVVSVPDEQGLMYWDDTRSTVALIMNGTLQHIGQDTFYYVKNSSGSTIPKGTAVRFAGTNGASGHVLIEPFLANGTYPSFYFMGVTAEAIGNGEFGQVMHFGELEGIDTTDFDAGDLLYASTTDAGGFQTTAPVAPNNIVLIAAAVNSKNNGAIIVRPTYGSNINNDEGVKLTSVADKNLLQYQSGTALWENKTLAQVLGGTSSQFVKGDGSLDSTSYQPLLTNPVTGTGASGQVAYFTGTSAISSESNLFWDAANDRLGINVSPSFSLDVNGVGRFSDGTQGLIVRAYTGADGWGAIYPVGVTPNTTNYTLIAKSTNAVLNASTSVTLAVSDSGKLTANSTGVQVNGRATIIGLALPMSVSSTDASELYCEYKYNTSTVVGYIGNGTGLMTGGGNDNFGIRAQNSLVFSTLSNERMRINSSGNVGIGTTSPVGKLDISTGGNRNIVISNDSVDTGYNIISLNGTRTKGSYAGIAGGGTGDDNLYLNSGSSVVIQTGASYTERMRITSVGDVYFGNPTVSVANTALFFTKSNGNIIQVFSHSSGTVTIQEYYKQGSGLTGSITYNGTNTLYNATSDYRLKEDLKDYNALQILGKLKTYDFKWKNTNTRDFGMLAHELQEVLPNYVSGQKDELTDDKSVKPQLVDYSKIVPLLIKSIQELKQEIDTLKN